MSDQWAPQPLTNPSWKTANWGMWSLCTCMSKHLMTFCRDHLKHSNFSCTTQCSSDTSSRMARTFLLVLNIPVFFILDFQYAFQFFNMSCVCTTVVRVNVLCLSHEKVQINPIQPHVHMYYWIKFKYWIFIYMHIMFNKHTFKLLKG